MMDDYGINNHMMDSYGIDNYSVNNYMTDDHRYDYERGYSFGYSYMDERGYLMKIRHPWGIGFEDDSKFDYFDYGNIPNVGNIGSSDESINSGLILKTFKFLVVGFLIFFSVWLLIFLLLLFIVFLA